MAHSFVIVRQFDGAPLRRVVICEGAGRVYVSSERAIERAESGELPPVGFERGDVFAFDERAFAALAARWAEQQVIPAEAWSALTPYQGEVRVV